ncbi:MAG: DEAD/DEAH box helicase, partial [Myxococcales bacterium]|nr:DEAD/DEAH box helicase [Myxococcales bacterium]
VLSSVLADPRARCLMLFPTKALARDQVRGLRALACGQLGVGLYDGDTPPDERRAARTRAHVVATNPDMLHRGVLPHHDRWGALLANLRYVVIDELHTYRGVFGSHVANVLRRLWRACRYHGSRPTIIACSATIANPGPFAELLCSRPEFTVVARDTAPAGPRSFVLLNPDVVDPLTGVRRDYLKVTRAVATELRRADIRTLAFCRTRKAVELLTRYLREDEARSGTGRDATGDRAAAARAARRVRGYRGGYLPERRREVEQALRGGEARIVATTHALELGVDIGGLDAVVLAGYPGTRAATRQRSGRAGRRQDRALTVMIMSSSPLDQFVANAPGFLFEQPPEHARLDPDNPEVLIPHLRCAAHELPLTGDEGLDGLDAAELQPALQYLADAGTLHREVDERGELRYFALGASFPADDVDLRGTQEENFAVLELAEAERDGRILAEVDFEDAPLYLHPGAIYAVEGRTYEVLRLDWEARKAFVRAVRARYYTEAVCRRRVRVVEPLHDGDEEDGRGATRSGVGYAHVVRTVPGFKKLRFGTHENIGFGPVRLPDLELHTVAAYWTVGADVVTALADPAARVSAALATAHALHHGAAMLLMCDVHDLGRAVAADPGGGGLVAGAPGGWAEVVDGRGSADASVALQASVVPCLYLYDAMPGGAGLARQAHALGRALFDHVLDVVRGCSCVRGCPTCTGPEHGWTTPARMADPGRGSRPAPRSGPPTLAGDLRRDVLHLLESLRDGA